MTTIVVGGHSRKVGKTSVAAAVIRAFPDHPWTAIKISSHLHTGSDDGDCVVIEEKKLDQPSDSARFLAAGAARSLWVGVRDGHMQEVLPRLRPILSSSPFVLIESNGILRYLEPDFYIMVVRYAVEEFKESARETLGRAHAIVAVDDVNASPPWRALVDERASAIPLFPTSNASMLPPGFLNLIKSRLESKRGL
jgi:hypothetical protein